MHEEKDPDLKDLREESKQVQKPWGRNKLGMFKNRGGQWPDYVDLCSPGGKSWDFILNIILKTKTKNP